MFFYFTAYPVCVYVTIKALIQLLESCRQHVFPAPHVWFTVCILIGTGSVVGCCSSDGLVVSEDIQAKALGLECAPQRLTKASMQTQCSPVEARDINEHTWLNCITKCIINNISLWNRESRFCRNVRLESGLLNMQGICLQTPGTAQHYLLSTWFRSRYSISLLKLVLYVEEWDYGLH